MLVSNSVFIILNFTYYVSLFVYEISYNTTSEENLMFQTYCYYVVKKIEQIQGLCDQKIIIVMC